MSRTVEELRRSLASADANPDLGRGYVYVNEEVRTLLAALDAANARAAKAEADDLSRLMKRVKNDSEDAIAHFNAAVFAGEQKARADKAEWELKEANAKLAELQSGRDRMQTRWRESAYSTVERELRAHELSVCSYEYGEPHGPGSGGYVEVWEGEEQDGWSLVAAVDSLKSGGG